MSKKSNETRGRLEELLKRRFFYTPSFSIYGGVAGLYDYGPAGCALQANILSLWRSHFVLEEQMLEVDCTVLTPHDVLKTSGHVDRFTDYMVKDLKNGEVHRADHLLEDHLKKLIEKETSEEKKTEMKSVMTQIDNFSCEELGQQLRRYNAKAPISNNDISDPEKFNLMFGTSIGPTGQFPGFMRPETAQGMFVNFKKLLEFNNDRMPFAAAQIGRSFRNEISPRAGLLRVREFTMAEIEHFVHPKKKDHPRFHEVKQITLQLLPSSQQLAGSEDVIPMTVGDAVEKGIINNQTLAYFLTRIQLFLLKIGIKNDRLRFRQHMPNEMAHYACDCWDAEIESSYGWVECVGCADRSAYDLTKHSEFTGQKLVAQDPLDKPITKEVWRLDINKKEIGQKFKKDAKVITDFLDRLGQEGLEKLSAVLSDENVKTFVVKAENDREVVVDKTSIKIEKVKETVHVDEYIPSVIEPSFGIGRIMYSLLEHSFWHRADDVNRGVLSFPPLVAPVKVAIYPLSKEEDFQKIIQKITSLLRKLEISIQIDESSASIGKRYSRNDELGVPFGITVDFQSVKDDTVTLRDRDTTKQIRPKVDELPDVVRRLVFGGEALNDIGAPEFLSQELDD